MLQEKRTEHSTCTKGVCFNAPIVLKITGSQNMWWTTVQ